LSRLLVFSQVQALEAEQATLERERPAAAPRPVVASAEAFPTLDLDRRRAVVETLVEAVVVAKAEHRGARWSVDRLEVVWRS
jgi:site-specific DNA recombinase